MSDEERRELQAVARDLIGKFPGEILFRSTFGADLLHEDGRVASRQILTTDVSEGTGTAGPSAKACEQSSLIDVGGVSATGTNGQVTISLSDYICRPGGRDAARYFSLPTIFLATPRSNTPQFMTSVQRIVERQVEFESNDVEITAHSWDATGAPAPDVPFNWRCLVAVDFTPT